MQVVVSVAEPLVYTYQLPHQLPAFLDKIVFLDRFLFSRKILSFKIAMSGRLGVVRGLPFG